MILRSALLLAVVVAGCTPSATKSSGPSARAVAGFQWTAGSSSVTIQVTVPAEHRLATVVINDAQGRRVRNLCAMQPVSNGVLSVAWDGLDDDGQPAPTGEYTVAGLSLAGLDAFFDYAWYNPGDPPWEGAPTSGWGGDHGDIVALACVPAGSTSQWRTVATSAMAECGDWMFVIGKNDRKVHGWYRNWGNASALAVADEMIWVGLAESKGITRYALDTGAVVGWPRPAGTIPTVKFESDLDRLAVGKTFAAATLRDPPVLLFLDKVTGNERARVPMPAPHAYLAVNPNDVLYASLPTGVFTVSADGTQTPVVLPGVAKPGPIAFDAAGNLYVFDAGEDYQVKVFSPDRQLLRTVGTRGGQKRPAYDPNAFQTFLAMAVDDRGWLWTSEGAQPRRIAVWDGAGKLVKDFVGNTYYGAWNCTLHNQDPTLASVFTLILKVGRDGYRPLRYFWSGRKPGSPFDLEQNVPWSFFHRNTMLRRDGHEYLLQTSLNFPVLYLQKNGDYRPVAAIWCKPNNPQQPVPWMRQEDPANAIYVWSDRNGDELVTADEVVLLDGPGFTGSGWVYNLSPQLDFYFGGYEIVPTRFTAEGAPIYETNTIRRLAIPEQDRAQMLTRVGRHLIGQRGDPPSFFTGKHLFFDLDGNLVATYPYKGAHVHGSMTANRVPGPGETMGELFISGTVDVGGEVGSVFAYHGNFGQAFFFTEDGLFISSLFKDSRAHPAPYRYEGSWKDVTMMQEPFTGWLGKQSDGKVRYLFGRNAALVVQVHGLEQIRRFTAGQVVVR
ncbi:MAG: hypothetical protein NZ483_04065 [Verrucomicrobiae bacterium]|nr:hypothetical protein [Verrucomicrobiae bacterium]